MMIKTNQTVRNINDDEIFSIAQIVEVVDKSDRYWLAKCNHPNYGSYTVMDYEADEWVPARGDIVKMPDGLLVHIVAISQQTQEIKTQEVEAVYKSHMDISPKNRGLWQPMAYLHMATYMGTHHEVS